MSWESVYELSSSRYYSYVILAVFVNVLLFGGAARLLMRKRFHDYKFRALFLVALGVYWNYEIYNILTDDLRILRLRDTGGYEQIVCFVEGCLPNRGKKFGGVGSVTIMIDGGGFWVDNWFEELADQDHCDKIFQWEKLRVGYVTDSRERNIVVRIETPKYH